MVCHVHATGTDPAVVTVAGEVDLAESADLAAALSAPLEHGHDVVVDMRRVGFIDCSGLRALLGATELARLRGHTLMVRPSPAVSRMLGLVRSLRRDASVVAARVPLLRES